MNERSDKVEFDTSTLSLATKWKCRDLPIGVISRCIVQGVCRADYHAGAEAEVSNLTLSPVFTDRTQYKFMNIIDNRFCPFSSQRVSNFRQQCCIILRPT